MCSTGQAQRRRPRVVRPCGTAAGRTSLEASRPVRRPRRGGHSPATSSREGVSGTTVLVTAATKDGSTGEIAQTIGAALTDRGLPAVGCRRRRSATSAGTTRSCSAAPCTPGTGCPRQPRWSSAARTVGGPAGLAVLSGPIGKPDRSLTKKIGRRPGGPVSRPRGDRRTGAPDVRRQDGQGGRRAVQRLGLTLFGMQGDFRDWNAIRTWSAGIADALREAPAC
jgi:hypothetical protein